MNSEYGRFLEVGHDADAEGPDPTEVEADGVDSDGPLADFVAQEELVNLLVADVDDNPDQQGTEVEQLRKDTRLCKTRTFSQLTRK